MWQVITVEMYAASPNTLIRHVEQSSNILYI